MKENFITREPDFYNKLHQTKFRDDETQNYQKIGVTVGNTKMTKKAQFHPEAPLIQYKKSSNSCCLSSLASDFHFIGDNRAVSDLVNYIEESLTL